MKNKDRTPEQRLLAAIRPRLSKMSDAEIESATTMIREILLKITTDQDISDDEMFAGMVVSAFDVAKSPLRAEVREIVPVFCRSTGVKWASAR